MRSNHNNQLKDFQEATVEYVFKRFTDSVNHCNRFLVADEVGLGKTLVARGIIKKFYDHFQSIGKSQLNVIYICSNQGIASQNINRLNIEQQKGFVPPPINRINDLAVTTMATNKKSFLQIIALSPKTSVMSSGGGIVRERAILYHILCRHNDLSLYRETLKNIFRLDVSETNWDDWTEKDSSIKTTLRPDIVTKFNTSLHSGNEYYSQLISACRVPYSNTEQYAYRRIIGGLRRLLASVCVEYLKTDLIIMDEFQRFKNLIDTDNDGDVKLITESLFTNNGVKILLLSATPYKMYSLQSEEVEAESHFEEFKFIVEFLLNNEARKKKFFEAWNEYSKSLLHLNERNWNGIKEEKKKVESILRGIIARTERITVSDDKNTLLRSATLQSLFIKPDDIKVFISADLIASKLKDVNSPVEYCKSSPFPFSFMEGYQLQKITQREIANGNTDLKSALRKSRDSFLPIEKMNDYTAIQNTNAKLTYLLNDLLYNGGSDLLWIPPSLPYYAFGGAFKGKEGYSKILIFSSWIMVPKMIAALSSYECERLTIADPKAISNAEDRSKREYFNTGSERHPKARLRFKIENKNYSALSSYALLYPCITLSELWKPLNKFQPLNELIEETSALIQSLISQINIQGLITEPNKKDDDRWALIYMLLLDKSDKSRYLNQFKESEDKFDWGWFNQDEETSTAYQYYEKIFKGILFADPSNVTIPAWRLARGEKSDNSVREVVHELKLGQPPVDIAKKLAYLTIASPAICAYRFLSSFTATQKQYNFISFFGAFRIADSFRKFFNWSEHIAVIDKLSDDNQSYWQNLLVYAANGNFQAMMDEFATAMIDHNGLWDYPLDDKLNKLIKIVAENIGLRTVSVVGHTYESFIKESSPSHFRCHFGVALNQSLDNEKDVKRSNSVRDSFNSPFRPFILTTTSIGQEGLDFHLYCRKILHWNLPANPVDFEQREGRINRFKNLAIRQNIAIKYGDKLKGADSSTVWDQLYQIAIDNEKGNKSDLVPFWHVEPQNIFIERQVPTIPYSKEVRKLKNLLKTISVYRIALGQPRQEDLVNHLINNFDEYEIKKLQEELLINLSPYRR